MPRLVRARLVPATRADVADLLDFAAAELERIGMRILVADEPDGMLRAAVPTAFAPIPHPPARRLHRRLSRPSDDRVRPRNRHARRGERGPQPRQMAGQRERPNRRARLAKVGLAHGPAHGSIRRNFAARAALAKPPAWSGAVAQFGRAPEWHSGGREFDPHRLHQISLEMQILGDPKCRGIIRAVHRENSSACGAFSRNAMPPCFDKQPRQCPTITNSFLTTTPRSLASFGYPEDILPPCARFSSHCPRPTSRSSMPRRAKPGRRAVRLSAEPLLPKRAV